MSRISQLFVLLAAVTVLGGIVFSARGSWGGWVLLGVAAMLVVTAVLVAREQRRSGR